MVNAKHDKARKAASAPQPQVSFEIVAGEDVVMVSNVHAETDEPLSCRQCQRIQPTLIDIALIKPAFGFEAAGVGCWAQQIGLSHENLHG